MSEIDYTILYTRMAVALETMATNSTSIKDSLAAIETDIANISTRSTTVANNQTTIANNQTTMANKITSIENKASNDGIRIIGPYEWLSMSSLLKIYDEQGVDLGRLRQEFLSRVPKDF